ncbi:Uncharacterized protein NEOC65_000870 [Neochlamydia sp. AcF65]|nr:Uncharacterized protein [Neochlamydia sp. AcF65]NGY95679.1 hypothetical protein [Neochlamydia sp. AcF84]
MPKPMHAVILISCKIFPQANAKFLANDKESTACIYSIISPNFPLERFNRVKTYNFSMSVFS